MHTYIGIDIGRSAVMAIARQHGRTYSVMFPAAVTLTRIGRGVRRPARRVRRLLGYCPSGPPAMNFC